MSPQHTWGLFVSYHTAAQSVPGTMRIEGSNRRLLLTAEVSLGGLDRGVSGQKLNLLQFSSGHLAQARTRPPEIVWC